MSAKTVDITVGEEWTALSATETNVTVQLLRVGMVHVAIADDGADLTAASGHVLANGFEQAIAFNEIPAGAAVFARALKAPMLLAVTRY